MARRCDLTGQRFGRLTVIEGLEKRKDGYQVWRCRCDCGGEIEASTRQLKSGAARDCGCRPRRPGSRGKVAEDLTGQKFGLLTVVSRAENRKGRTCWLCRCDCGRERVVASRDLKSGKASSCGCQATRRGYMDLTGQRFGRLQVLEPTERRDRKGSIYWRCICDCGRETLVTQEALVRGKYQSCGCLKRENQREIVNQLHRIDGTCVEILENRKYRRDNTSGFRGVFQLKNGRYRVSIGFKGQRFYLGTYEDYQEAVAARLKAEEEIHERFLEAYYQWKEKAEEDPGWGEKNPLKFEVGRKDGELVVLEE